eukprot:3541602-Amphidinium_carterae.1
MPEYGFFSQSAYDSGLCSELLFGSLGGSKGSRTFSMEATARSVNTFAKEDVTAWACGLA